MKSVTVKSLVAKIIPRSKIDYVPRSYDLIGDIAVVDIKDEVKRYEKEIAKAIMQIQKNIKVVAKKTSAVKEKFRVRKLKVIAGEKRTETTYREHGCAIKVDVSRVYFSPRLNNERGRIAELVKPRENVLVYFAGAGPFALVIAKKQKLANVIGIELNPAGVKYFNENIALNRLAKVKAIKGDVKRQAKKFAGWADRIVMPLPQSAEKFLDCAFLDAKNNAMVHFYNFVNAENPFEEAREKIRKAAGKGGCMVKFINERIVLQYSPQTVEVCIDFQVRKSVNLKH